MQSRLVIDLKKARQNLERVFDNRIFDKISFRPHFKTHQSIETGRLFREFAIKKITVSSLAMAKFFAADKWKDILIAIPLNPIDVKEYSALASQVKLHLLLDSVEVTKYAVPKISESVTFHIKCDCGYGRAGISVQEKEKFTEIISLIQKHSKHNFGGLISHFGNTYHANSKKITKINQKGISQLVILKDFIEKTKNTPCPISIGDTPSLGIYTKEMLKPIDELRPGNFVYFDCMQMIAGHCKTNDIAAALKVPILSMYPERNEILIHGGAIHLSKENCIMPDGKTGFGIAVKLNNSGIAEPIAKAFVDRLSQEHGILRVNSSFFQKFKPGDNIGILPVHSCLMVGAFSDID